MFSKDRSVLIVEDDPASGVLACEMLRNAGYFPTWAQSLTEATLLEKIPFSAIFLDLLLPETQDRNFVRAVSSIRLHFPDAILIVLSAFLPEANVMNLLRHGADFALHKPLSTKNVKEIMHRAGELHNGRLDGILARLEAVSLT